MNLQRLFEAQRKLDAYIEREHPREPGEDRLAKKNLALLVELGELANEHRGFKFWSNDQKPRKKVQVYSGSGRKIEGKYKNPLLEEYVDCLHFILSIGLEITEPEYINLLEIDESIFSESIFGGINSQFLEVFERVMDFYTFEYESVYYESLLANFLKLGEMLGFTWEQIEEAYLKKNAENHRRQESGY